MKKRRRNFIPLDGPAAPSLAPEAYTEAVGRENRTAWWYVKIGLWAIVWLLFPVWAIAHGTYLMVRREERNGVRLPRWFRIIVLTVGSLPLAMFVLFLISATYFFFTGQLQV